MLLTVNNWLIVHVCILVYASRYVSCAVDLHITHSITTFELNKTNQFLFSYTRRVCKVCKLLCKDFPLEERLYKHSLIRREKLFITAMIINTRRHNWSIRHVIYQQWLLHQVISIADVMFGVSFIPIPSSPGISTITVMMSSLRMSEVFNNIRTCI